MELSVLKKEVMELDEILRGGFIAKIYQPLPREIILKIRLATFGEKRLTLSADPRLGRIHTTSVRIPNPPSPPRFCAYLRAHLQGARIMSMEVPKNDRVIVMKCARGQNERAEKRLLILEILGRDSNIILIRDSDGSIMECLHRLYAKEEHNRYVIPGVVYQYPPPNPRLSDRNEKDFAGPETPLSEINPKESCNAVSAFDRQLVEKDAGCLDKDLDSRYAILMQKEIVESYRRSLKNPINNRIKSLKKRLNKIEQDKKRLNMFVLQQKMGELIKYNLGKIQKGMTRVDLLDWETNETKTVELDPSLSPLGNMESYFRKASKAKRGFSIVEERLIMTRQEIDALQDLDYLVSDAHNLQELEHLADDIQFKPHSGSDNPPKSPGKKREPQPRPYIEHKSPAGHKIMVGKSARGNDFILRRLVGKDDLWLHAKDWAGAHVFLESPGNFPITHEDIVFAASLALGHSKGRNESKGEVMVANVKDVSRVKGGVTGQVKVRAYHSVVVVPLSDSQSNEVGR